MVKNDAKWDGELGHWSVFGWAVLFSCPVLGRLLAWQWYLPGFFSPCFCVDCLLFFLMQKEETDLSTSLQCLKSNLVCGWWSHVMQLFVWLLEVMKEHFGLSVLTRWVLCFVAYVNEGARRSMLLFLVSLWSVILYSIWYIYICMNDWHNVEKPVWIVGKLSGF